MAILPNQIIQIKMKRLSIILICFTAITSCEKTAGEHISDGLSDAINETFFLTEEGDTVFTPDNNRTAYWSCPICGWIAFIGGKGPCLYDGDEGHDETSTNNGSVGLGQAIDILNAWNVNPANDSLAFGQYSQGSLTISRP